MTLTVTVQVPLEASYVAEVVSTDLDLHGNAVQSHRQFVEPGREGIFHPHATGSLTVREVAPDSPERPSGPEHVFAFRLEQRVHLALSGEEGTVIARSDSVEAKPSYFVRYITKDGRQTEAWWTGAALRKGPAPSLPRHAAQG